MNKQFRKFIDEPNMSDKTLLLSVEDIISSAFGSLKHNSVNFKLIQTVLHILARQMRLLEQDVEIKFDEMGIEMKKEAEMAGESDTSIGEKSKRDEKGEKKDRGKDDKGRKGEKRGKGEKGEKEDEGHDKASAKDKERGRKGKGEADRGAKHRGKSRGKKAGKQDSATSITVSEAARRAGEGGSGTVLVAEQGPQSGGRPARIGSIEIVTASQFALLEEKVTKLEQISGPPPEPSMPDNDQLRKDLAEGRASLSDTMQAVQLNARVRAAEKGLSCMADILTQLAALGVLPESMVSRIEELQAELNQAAAAAGYGSASTRFAPGTEGEPDTVDSKKSVASGMGRSARSRKSMAEKASVTEAPSVIPEKIVPVSHAEMEELLENMKEELKKEMIELTARANHSADIASNTSRTVAEKLEIALNINERITQLDSQTADYAEQLSGFDSGLTTQLSSFQEQMMQMKQELKGGLTLLESANNNAETAAILDLTERYQTLVLELDNTVHLHQNITSLQNQLAEELKSLVECVEMLREQKADRDEVLDGLRDKADISRLAGLLYEKDFAKARRDIERRIERTYEKFRKQDSVWQIALKDLSLISESKAENIALMALKDAATRELNSILERLHRVDIMLGEPKAALLMRQLARDGACGACLTRALMPLTDAVHGKPQALPPLRGPPLGAGDVCVADPKLMPPDSRKHICHRWAGGSHTLVMGNVTREKAEPAVLQIMPSKKYEGYGNDGRLYRFEEDLLPCAECNQLGTEGAGAGDQAAVPPAAAKDTAQ